MMLQKAPVADEENFMEACSALYRACTVYTLPVHVEQVLKDPQCDHMTSEVGICAVIGLNCFFSP